MSKTYAEVIQQIESLKLNATPLQMQLDLLEASRFETALPLLRPT